MLRKLLHSGLLLYVILLLTPLIIWLEHVGLASIYASPGTLVASLGKACAFVGLTSYAIMPILSMRHRLLEKLFGSLDALYFLHKKSGVIILGLVVGHPILLGAGRLLDGKSITTIWNWTSTLVLSGIVALIIVITLILIAMYAHIKHRLWVQTHRFLGWVLPLLVIHGMLANSKMMQITLLADYLIVLSSIGFAAFLYRAFYRLFAVRFPYQIAEVHHPNDSVTELVLKPLSVPITYQPGQFAFVTIECEDSDNEAHPFSFTTANNGPYVRFAIKRLGDGTSQIQNVKPGSKAYIEGPFGSFSHNRSSNPNQVWIAGGVGITPFLSMARSLQPDQSRIIHMFYAVDSQTDAVFLDELKLINRTIPETFKLTLIDKQTTGFITIDLLKQHLPNLASYDFLICGPPPMLNGLRKGLVESGVSSHQIFFEAFSMH